MILLNRAFKFSVARINQRRKGFFEPSNERTRSFQFWENKPRVFFLFRFPLNLMTLQLKQYANSNECFTCNQTGIRHIALHCIAFLLQFKLTKYGLCVLVSKIHILKKKHGIPRFQRRLSVGFTQIPRPRVSPCFVFYTDPGTPCPGGPAFSI